MLTSSSPDIVKRKVGDAGVELHQQRQWLPNASRSTQDGDFRRLLQSATTTTSEYAPPFTCLADAEKALRWQAPSICREANIVFVCASE